MMQPLMNFIGNFAYVIVCIVGAVLAAQGKIEFGVIVAFMLYIRNFTYPLQNISQSLQSVQSMAAACARVAVPCGWSMLPSLVPTPEIRPVATAHDSAGSA